jgi:hypothetical protein
MQTTRVDNKMAAKTRITITTMYAVGEFHDQGENVKK